MHNERDGTERNDIALPRRSIEFFSDVIGQRCVGSSGCNPQTVEFGERPEPHVPGEKKSLGRRQAGPAHGSMSIKKGSRVGAFSGDASR
jgi:hypothetical protein